MSAEKISIDCEQAIQLLIGQKAVIEKTREKLFSLGKNYEKLSFYEFRKQFRGLIFSVDLEKHTKEFNEVLSKIEVFINHYEFGSILNRNGQKVIFQLREGFKEHEVELNTFKEAMLELRDMQRFAYEKKP